MHKLLASWLFPAIFVGVSIFLILFLIQVNKTDASIYAEEANIPQAQALPTLPSKEQWLAQLSEHEKEGFYYPVTEIFVEVDLEDPRKKAKMYQLRAGELDPYQLYCLKEILKQYETRYLFEQKDKEMKLRVYSENLPQLKKIVKTLKNYAINAEIISVER
jgi:hypothetical protein